MKPHLVATLGIWILLTAVGELLVVADIFPTVGSAEAKDFDFIFRFLLILGIPVFTFVISVLVYAGLKFRQRGAPAQDGPVMYGRGAFPIVWLAITGSLAIFVMIYPGMTGLAKLQRDSRGYGWEEEEPELVLEVTGSRFYWNVEYPDGTVVTGQDKEMVLPVDTVIRFNATATDVIHSMWIPAFRMRIDAVPGRTTHMSVKPTELGTFQTDDAFRFQCSMLCGLDHAKMRLFVTVVPKDEFENWLAGQKSQGK